MFPETCRVSKFVGVETPTYITFRSLRHEVCKLKKIKNFSLCVLRKIYAEKFSLFICSFFGEKKRTRRFFSRLFFKIGRGRNIFQFYPRHSAMNGTLGWKPRYLQCFRVFAATHGFFLKRRIISERVEQNILQRTFCRAVSEGFKYSRKNICFFRTENARTSKVFEAG